MPALRPQSDTGRESAPPPEPSHDWLDIERQRLELERLRTEAEFDERLHRRQSEDRVKTLRRFLADTIAAFEEIRREFP